MLRRRTLCASAVALTVAVFVPTSASAQASLQGPTFSLGGTTRPVELPDVAYDSVNNRYLQVAGKEFIEGHLLDASGGILSTFRVNSTGNYAQGPRVGFSPHVNGGGGGYLVTWHESIGNFARVRGRLFTADGAAATGDFDIATSAVSIPTSTNWVMAAAIAYSTNPQEFMVAWAGNKFSTADIFFQRISTTGALLGGNTLVSGGGADQFDRDPSVVYSPDAKEFYIVWGAYSEPGRFGYAAGRRVRAGTGEFVGSLQTFTPSLGVYVTAATYNTAARQYLLGWYTQTRTGPRVDGVVLNGVDGSVVSDTHPLSARFAAYDALDIDYNEPSGQSLLVTHSNIHEDAGVTILSDGNPYDNGFLVTQTTGVNGNFNPRVAASTREKKWLVVTSTGFSRVGAQFVVSGATGKKKTTSHDFDGDGKSDATFYRPASGQWWIKHSSNPDNFQIRSLGDSESQPVPGDYDGDGKPDIAVWKQSNGLWTILTSSSNYSAAIEKGWGSGAAFRAVPGDYDGDGRTDIAVWNRVTGIWWILTSSSNFNTNAYVTKGWGDQNFVPVQGDYDGDGKTDIAVFRPSTGIWWILRSSTNNQDYFTKGWGDPNFVPVHGDYDGDGKTDIAVWRPSTGIWWILTSSSGYGSYFTQGWGDATYIAVPADYDGDGRTDIAVWHPATRAWWVRYSASNYVNFSDFGWGTAGDIPLQSLIR
jgi:hypothetical protein